MKNLESLEYLLDIFKTSDVGEYDSLTPEKSFTFFPRFLENFEARSRLLIGDLNSNIKDRLELSYILKSLISFI
jgi:hypothetical protein